MLRILIFGAAGSGTTTLASRLSEALSIPHIDSDEYYWVKTDPPFVIKQPLETRQSNLKAVLEKENNWVVSGSLHNWGAFIADMLTHAIFLHVPKKARMYRILLREQNRFGGRIEKGGDMYEHHKEFLEWAGSYDNDNAISRTKAKHLAWANLLPCSVLKIEGDEDIDTVLKRVITWIEQSAKKD